jgi:beta-lactamase superfamily II metal-dependent hydrolase
VQSLARCFFGKRPIVEVIMPESVRYIRQTAGKFSIPMEGTARDGSKRVLQHLLWGDRARVLETDGVRTKVRARGMTGWIPTQALGDTALLEMYVIDVGQGDSVLLRLPDGRHVLVDGGFKRSAQPSGKSAADFVDWKFVKDYGTPTIHIDAMVASHCDADHYGGLSDLFLTPESEQGADELDAEDVQVDAFYHAGVGWWTSPAGRRTIGPVESGLLTLLVEDKADLQQTIANGKRGHKLQGEWAAFLKLIHAEVPTVQRVHAGTGYLPGFEPDGTGRPSIKVLGPVQRTTGSRTGVRAYGSDSLNTNGNSVLLRVDYGKARIVLTGDLNTPSQRALLEHWAGHEDEFACDVAKACHHGSDDILIGFLEAMNPAVTIFSSGDNETHDHPRPGIVGATGATGFKTLDGSGEKLLTPLVYSTELARSINIGLLESLDLTVANQKVSYARGKFTGVVQYLWTKAGALRPQRRKRTLKGCYVVGGIVYGLVNVRTDGTTILCATRNEADASWKIKTLPARF